MNVAPEITYTAELNTATSIATSTQEVVEAYKEIDSPEVYAAAGDELRSIAAKIKRLDSMRLEITRPMDLAKKKVMELFGEPMSRLEKSDKDLRAAMLTFQSAERKRADEEKRKAEAASKAEQRALEEKIATAPTEAEREEATVQLEIAQVAPPAQAVTVAPKAAGVSVRENWKHEVLSPTDLICAAVDEFRAGRTMLMAYVEPNDKVLGQAARSLKGAARIPGVRIYNTEALAVRA